MAIWNVDVEIAQPLTREQRGTLFEAIERDDRSPLDGFVGDPRGEREAAWISVEAPSPEEAANLARTVIADGLRSIGVVADLSVTDVSPETRS
jgi:hypothetical protein